MTEMLNLSRRSFLAGAGGGLVVGFSMGGVHAQSGDSESEGPDLPGSLSDAPLLDSWIRIDDAGQITVFTGKADLGQGISTALVMVAAEELGVDPAGIEILTADTAETPNEGFTAASHSMEMSGMAIRNAAANVRYLLLQEAARQLGSEPDQLVVEGGEIRGPSGAIGFGPLAASIDLAVPARPDVPLRAADDRSVYGSDFLRLDIPAIVTGAQHYVQDLRPIGMVHARVVRPPSVSARLVSVDVAAVEQMPGVIGTHRDGNFLAVVAEREFQVILAMRALADASRWEERESLPEQSAIYDWLRDNVEETGTVAESGSPSLPEGERTITARFNRPYMMHGSIGPSCAVAIMDGDQLAVASHTQGVYPDRDAIAEMLGMPPENVRVAHYPGAGCYGHNGADDAAADAALIARAFPGRPIRLSWMREQEHGWEPYGSAMTMDVAGAVDADGRITHWNYDLWSCAHSTRPGGAAHLLPATLLADPIEFDLPDLRIIPPGLGDRNAVPLYAIPNKRVLYHFVKQMPLRTSALRALGAYGNVFALESFMDELALVAQADPVEFRLRHLEDPRAVAVVEKAAEEFGWSSDPLPPNLGRGFAFARYKNMAAYLALALDLEVEPATGRVKVGRVTAAVDSGAAVSLDGIRNQTEGGIIQSLSWTLYEEVIFDRMGPTSIDWSSYPMLRFESVPDEIAVHVIDRPDEPFLGTGEAAQGPTGAAIGNAIRDAVGIRLTDLPLTRTKVVAALDQRQFN